MIAKNVARFHAQNRLIFGIRPMIFGDPADGDAIVVRDWLRMTGLCKALQQALSIAIETVTEGKPFRSPALWVNGNGAS